MMQTIEDSTITQENAEATQSIRTVTITNEGEDFDTYYQSILAELAKRNTHAHFFGHDVGSFPTRAMAFMCNIYAGPNSEPASVLEGYDAWESSEAEAQNLPLSSPLSTTSPESVPPVLQNYLPKTKHLETAIIDAASKALKAIDTKGYPSEQKDLIIKKVQAIQQYAPILFASAEFLQLPSDETQARCNEHEIYLDDLFLIPLDKFLDLDPKVLTEALTKVPHIKLNGLEATICYNLLKNAAYFSRESTLPYRVDQTTEDKLVISNTCSSCLPEAFGIGRPGQNGNTGYGIPTVKLIALKEGLTVYATQKPQGEQNEISFIVQKNRRAVSE